MFVLSIFYCSIQEYNLGQEAIKYILLQGPKASDTGEDYEPDSDTQCEVALEKQLNLILWNKTLFIRTSSKEGSGKLTQGID